MLLKVLFVACILLSAKCQGRSRGITQNIPGRGGFLRNQIANNPFENNPGQNPLSTLPGRQRTTPAQTCGNLVVQGTEQCDDVPSQTICDQCALLNNFFIETFGVYENIGSTGYAVRCSHDPSVFIDFEGIFSQTILPTVTISNWFNGNTFAPFQQFLDINNMSQLGQNDSVVAMLTYIIAQSNYSSGVGHFWTPQFPIGFNINLQQHIIGRINSAFTDYYSFSDASCQLFAPIS